MNNDQLNAMVAFKDTLNFIKSYIYVVIKNAFTLLLFLSILCGVCVHTDLNSNSKYIYSMDNMNIKIVLLFLYVWVHTHTHIFKYMCTTIYNDK